MEPLLRRFHPDCCARPLPLLAIEVKGGSWVVPQTPTPHFRKGASYVIRSLSNRHRSNRGHAGNGRGAVAVPDSRPFVCRIPEESQLREAVPRRQYFPFGLYGVCQGLWFFLLAYVQSGEGSRW